MHYLKFTGLLNDGTWISPAYVTVNGAGKIVHLSNIANPDTVYENVHGLALPGWINSHSHAFQYAMSGVAERHAMTASDDFWTWREAMYQCALTVDPDQAEAIAAMVYAEMVQCGYTHVVEFHYLHHEKNGKPYSNLAEMGQRMINAAATAGISITLVPVFYQNGNFGTPPQDRQRRFISKNSDEYFNLLAASATIVKSTPHAHLGFSVHSLRAVDQSDIVRTYQDGPKQIPFHLHVSEQLKEVADCIAWCGARPVQWVLDNLPVDDRFNLVHATHLDDREVKGLAASQASVVLCPSTEGNLGDGIFRMREYTQLFGRWSIGTDSHIGLNPLEEFRMIDYRQRLVSHLRNTFPTDPALYMSAESVARGRLGAGITGKGDFDIGDDFDAVVYDQTPLLENCSPANLLSTLVYVPHAAKNLGTIIRGRWVARDGVHSNIVAIREAFSKTMSQLANR